MNALQENVANGPLTDALAGIVGYLRIRRYGGIVGRLEQAFLGACNRFVSVLAEHLEHEENEIFPELRALAPQSGPALERLVEQHRLLRIYAQDLAQRLKREDEEGAAGVARAFLVALLEHVDAENGAIDSILTRLDPESREAVESRWKPEGPPPETRPSP